MDIKQLIEKMDQFAGQAVGQKPGDQFKGSDAAPPGKKLVGDSMLKDLHKGKTPKSKEQELAEEFQAFSEAEFKDTVDKRPSRKGARHSRGHEPKSGYKTIKADEGTETAPTALADPIVAKVVKQMRPGLTGLNMGNEAFLYFAYELGKQRARDSWEDYLPAIRHAYEQGLNEGWESGPEEYKEPYDDADDAYDRQRQEKIDTEAEREWAKLPKVSTYKLVGRGPNMEPNHEFGDEFDSMEQALEYRAKIMKDPKTPHPQHIGIRTITRVVDNKQTDEAVQGGGHIKNLEDYTAKRDYIYKQLANPKQVDNYSHFKQALFDLNRLAKEQDIEIEESRAHKQLDTWFKNRELAQKYASGEVKVPTPQERRAELEKPRKSVKEYGATSTGSATSDSNISLTNPNDPEVAKKVAQATTTLKSATQSTASNLGLAKALDAASQGKSVTSTDMKALEPMMDVLQKAGTDPQLANQFKQLVQKVTQTKV